MQREKLPARVLNCDDTVNKLYERYGLSTCLSFMSTLPEMYSLFAVRTSELSSQNGPRNSPNASGYSYERACRTGRFSSRTLRLALVPSSVVVTPPLSRRVMKGCEGSRSRPDDLLVKPPLTHWKNEHSLTRVRRDRLLQNLRDVYTN